MLDKEEIIKAVASSRAGKNYIWTILVFFPILFATMIIGLSVSSKLEDEIGVVLVVIVETVLYLIWFNSKEKQLRREVEKEYKELLGGPR